MTTWMDAPGQTPAEKERNRLTVERIMLGASRNERPPRVERPMYGPCGSCGERRGDYGGADYSICSRCAVESGLVDCRGRICDDPQGWPVL